MGHINKELNLVKKTESEICQYMREATNSLDKEKGKNILPRGKRYDPLNTL